MMRAMDDLVKRWRWVMLSVILFDIAITLIGQPASYWTNPLTAHEGNQWFHPIMARGPWVSVAVDFVYLSGCFLLVSLLPRRIGITLMLGLLLGHFFGGSTWICYKFGFGIQGVVLYSIFVSGLLSWLVPEKLH